MSSLPTSIGHNFTLSQLGWAVTQRDMFVCGDCDSITLARERVDADRNLYLERRTFTSWPELVEWAKQA